MRRVTILIAVAIAGLAGCSLGGSDQEAAIRAESELPPSPSSPGSTSPADPSLKPKEGVSVSASPEPEDTAASLDDEPSDKSDKERFKTLDDAVAAGNVDTAVADALGDSGEVDAIVTFEHRSILANAQANAPKRGRSAAVLQSIKPAYKALKARAMGRVQAKATVLDEYENLAVLLVRFESDDAVLSVANAPGVTGIREDRQLPVLLEESLPLVRQPQLPAGSSGSGVSVAVIDTGVAYNQYPSYFGTCTAPGSPSSCRVRAAYEAAANDGQTDANGHGSHVASIVSSVAPGTGIVSVDVFGSKVDADGNTLTETGAIAKAVNWIVGQRATYNIKAMNLSLGGGRETGACSQTQTDSDGQDTADFTTARAVEILPVVASGNSAYDSTGTFHEGIAWPACVPGAVSVGATFDDYLSFWQSEDCYDFPADVDQVTCFSQTGDNLDMLAPGAAIDAAGGLKQGTSMAAPHVAGAAAVLAAARPSATVQQLESALMNTGTPIADSRVVNLTPKRRLDIPAALAALPAADTTPPAVTAPTQDVSLYRQLGTMVVPVTVSWSATDSSGVAAYALSVSTNGGAYAAVNLPTATTRSLTFNLTPGSSYRFRAGAQDGAGSWSAWIYGPTFAVDAHQETSTSITYSGTWTRLAWSSAYGGYQRTASATNAWARLSFTGRAVGWVAAVATNRGKAYVYVDGVHVQTLDLYAATTTARKIVFSRSWPSSGAHTITVQVVGTAGRPAIDVDAFAVLR